MELAACTVTLAPEVLACSSMPCCIDWKNGLSRPLMTAATLALPPPPEPVPLDPPELQAASATAPRVSANAAAVPRRAVVVGSICCPSLCRCHDVTITFEVWQHFF
jgi:hypothetical protein